jgi:hypothetical protein
VRERGARKNGDAWEFGYGTKNRGEPGSTSCGMDNPPHERRHHPSASRRSSTEACFRRSTIGNWIPPSGLTAMPAPMSSAMSAKWRAWATWGARGSRWKRSRERPSHPMSSTGWMPTRLSPKGQVAFSFREEASRTCARRTRCARGGLVAEFLHRTRRVKAGSWPPRVRAKPCGAARLVRTPRFVRNRSIGGQAFPEPERILHQLGPLLGVADTHQRPMDETHVGDPASVGAPSK